MRLPRRQVLAGLGSLGFLAGCGSSESNVLNPAAAVPWPLPQATSGTSKLFVLNAESGAQNGNRLVLRGVTPDTIFFEDRPGRTAGRLTTAEFVAGWSAFGFTAVPPNAVLQVGVGGGATTHVFEIADPVYDAATSTLTFAVRLDAGQAGGPAPASFGPAALFIDDAGANYDVPVQGQIQFDVHGQAEIRMTNLTHRVAFAVTDLSNQLRTTDENRVFVAGYGGEVDIYAQFIKVNNPGCAIGVRLMAEPGIQEVTFTTTGADVIYKTRGGLQARLTGVPTVLPWGAVADPAPKAT